MSKPTQVAERFYIATRNGKRMTKVQVKELTRCISSLIGEEFELVDEGAIIQREQPAPKTLRIEKNRDTKHDVTKPSIGGMCRRVWDWCDSFKELEKRPPCLAEAKATAKAHDWNENNTVIEYYRWRQFNGISGRIACK